MFQNSVLNLIVENYDRFTNVEKTIADYFLNNHNRSNFSAKAIKERIFVSEASLSRFSQKLGFKGYREFIYKYEEQVLLEKEPLSYGLRKVVNDYHNLLKNTINRVQEEQIRKLCKLINDSKYVVVMGVGSSGLVAKEMKSRFMRLGILIDAIDQPDEMKMKSVMIGSDVLVIGLSLSGEKSEVIFSLKNAKNNNAKVILITSNQNNNYDFCDEVIFVPSLLGLDTGAIISPQFPLLVMIDLCYYNFIYEYSNKSNRELLHKKTVDIIQKDGK